MGEDARADWRDVCGSYCNVKTNERGLRLSELDCYSWFNPTVRRSPGMFQLEKGRLLIGYRDTWSINVQFC